MEAFACARVNSRKAGGEACYRLTIAALEGKTFRSQFGLTITADKSLFDLRDVDTFLIPGGSGLRERNGHPRLTAWLQKNAGSIRRIGSICTGIYGLAPSGLLNGRKVATHWKFAADVAEALSRAESKSRLALRKGWKVLDRRGSDGGHRSFAGPDRGGLRLGGGAFRRARTGCVHEEVRRAGAVFGTAEVPSTIAQPPCGSFAVDVGAPGAGSFGRGAGSASFVVSTAVFAALYARVWEQPGIVCAAAAAGRGAAPPFRAGVYGGRRSLLGGI